MEEAPVLKTTVNKDKVEKMDKSSDHQEATEGCDERSLPA